MVPLEREAKLPCRSEQVFQRVSLPFSRLGSRVGGGWKWGEVEVGRLLGFSHFNVEMSIHRTAVDYLLENAWQHV